MPYATQYRAGPPCRVRSEFGTLLQIPRGAGDRARDLSRFRVRGRAVRRDPAPRLRSGDVKIRVLIVDDHAVVRQGLRIFLDTERDFDVVAEAPDGEEAVRLARALRPDIVLMDLLMPGMDGTEATRRIRAELDDVEVVALTSVLDDESVVAAVRAGAIGYLLKSAEPAWCARSGRRRPWRR
ncbi:MAG: response regulator transcription factor [Chloroflexi bacterium]|nr:MAG: response regulator transcription factor [Chloroflexota bacterium]